MIHLRPLVREKVAGRPDEGLTVHASPHPRVAHLLPAGGAKGRRHPLHSTGDRVRGLAARGPMPHPSLHGADGARQPVEPRGLAQRAARTSRLATPSSCPAHGARPGRERCIGATGWPARSSTSYPMIASANGASGHGDPADVVRMEATERAHARTCSRAVQRAMVLGPALRRRRASSSARGTVIPAALAGELLPEAVGPNGVAFLHAVSRWQLARGGDRSRPAEPLVRRTQGL